MARFLLLFRKRLGVRCKSLNAQGSHTRNMHNVYTVNCAAQHDALADPRGFSPEIHPVVLAGRRGEGEREVGPIHGGALSHKKFQRTFCTFRQVDIDWLRDKVDAHVLEIACR